MSNDSNFKSSMANNRDNPKSPAFKERPEESPHIGIYAKANKLQKDLLTLSMKHVKAWHDTSDNDEKLRSSEDLKILKAVSATFDNPDISSGVGKAAEKMKAGISADALISLLLTRDDLYNIPKI